MATHPQRKFRYFPVAAFLAVISATMNTGPVHGQQAPTPEIRIPGSMEFAPRGQRLARDIRYGEWQKFCFKPGGTKAVCRTTISGDFETGQTAVRVDLVEREGEPTARLQLFLPVGVYLQSPASLTVDQGSAYQLPYTWCLSNACIAADVANASLLREMEAGQTLQLRIVDISIISVITQISLKNFASTRHNAPTKVFDQAIDE